MSFEDTIASVALRYDRFNYNIIIIKKIETAEMYKYNKNMSKSFFFFKLVHIHTSVVYIYESKLTETKKKSLTHS